MLKVTTRDQNNIRPVGCSKHWLFDLPLRMPAEDRQLNMAMVENSVDIIPFSGQQMKNLKL